MPRLIRHDATGPIKIDPQDKPVFICGCGLSQKFPFCDGKHKACKSEKPDVLYTYDTTKENIVDEQPDIN